MYKRAPMTDRVARIRERYRTTVPNIDINRYRIVTEFYMANPQLQGNLKRAKALREICGSAWCSAPISSGGPI